MKALYMSEDAYLIKIGNKKFYYGNGETLNAFAESAAHFLRFNPYMEDVSEDEIKIPEKIIKYIENKKG